MKNLGNFKHVIVIIIIIIIIIINIIIIAECDTVAYDEHFLRIVFPGKNKQYRSNADHDDDCSVRRCRESWMRIQQADAPRHCVLNRSHLAGQWRGGVP